MKFFEFLFKQKKYIVKNRVHIHLTYVFVFTINSKVHMYLLYFFFYAIKRIWHTTYKQIGLYQAKKTGTQQVKVPDPWRINSTRIRNYPATRQDFLNPRIRGD